MFAVIEAGGKQFKVLEGDVLTVEKINAEVGTKLSYKAIMFSDGEKFVAGSACPNVVEAEVVEHGKGDKVVVFKYKAKKNERKKQGHRQPYTKIKITAIK